jgi:hypothetical protein
MEPVLAFYQQSLFNKSGIILLKNGVTYQTKNFQSDKEYTFSYDAVLPYMYSANTRERIPAFAYAGVMLFLISYSASLIAQSLSAPLVAAICILVGILALLGGLGMYMFYSVRKLGIPIEMDGATKYLLLYADKPNKEEFDFAIEQLYAMRRAYFRKHYFTIFSQSPKDAEVRRIGFLLDDNIISKQEHDSLIEILMEDSEDFDELD